MRICLHVLLVLLLMFSTLPVSAQEAAPLEQLILQQHFTQKEIERNLGLIKTEAQRLESDVAQLDVDLQRQKLVIEAMRRHAGDVAHAYYTGERVSLLSLLFDTENFNDFLLLFDFLQLLYQRDMSRLESFQAERAKAAAMQTDQQRRLVTLKDLRLQYEKQLAEMLAIQAEKEKNVAELTDPTSVQSLMDHLIADWRTRGLPAFQTYFGVLSNVMFQIPELATPERITSDGLFSHTFTIKQEEFNQFLISKDQLFKQSYFTFDNNQLIIDSTFNQMELQIVGTYELVSPKELKFHINQLYFDGFELPETTIKEMEKAYNLGFYPELISPNILVEGITLTNQELKLLLKVNLPFGFGKK